MAEKSFPFPSVNGDRKYKASDWAGYFASVLSNGVFPAGTQLQVTPSTGMTVMLSAGSAWLNGYGYNNDTALSLSIAVADGVLNRIDRVIIQWQRAARQITAVVKAGTPASTPSAPTLTRNEDYYELCVATVAVNAGSVAITAADITDTRLDPIVCGIVSSLITPDTDGWFEQFSDAWDTWFADIKGQLSEDAATNLYNIKYDKPLRFFDTTVTADLWVADATHPDYGYKADIPLTGVTAAMVPDVVLLLTVATSGEVAPVALCGTGYVRLYASVAQAAMTIPTITCWKEV